MKKLTYFFKISGLFLLLSFVAGCTSSTTPAIAFLSTVTGVVLDDKLPTDYIAEAFTDKDCSYIRQLEDGGPLCRSADYGKVIAKPIYCYKALGGVSCFNEPDPYGDGQTKIQ